MKRIIFAIVICILINYLVKASDILSLNIDTLNNPSPGYLFLSLSGSGEFFIVDNSGGEIYKKEIENKSELNCVKLQNDLITFFSGDKFFAMNQDYEIVDSFAVICNSNTDFHDMLLLPNGNCLLIGFESRDIDMSVIVPGGYQYAQVVGNVIQELDKNKNLVFEWKSLDHFKVTDVTSDIPLTYAVITSCHMNSISIDTDGNILSSSRVLDEITKIDRKTGDVIWRLGGKECKNNQFKYLNDTIDGFWGFSHQHSVTALPNGNILLFDNGTLKPNPYSRAVEYKIDEKNMTVEKVWEYRPSPDIFSGQMGSVQRLTDGNTLIGWGGNKRNELATEVHPDGTKAIEISDFQNYSVFRYIFKMACVQKFIDKPCLYDFSDDSNRTGVNIIIDSLDGSGFLSVEKHDYQPHNMTFVGQNPKDISQNRWTVSHNGISDLSATITFDIEGLTLPKPEDAIIYYRSTEGKGRFNPLQTIFNNIENCIETRIKGTGEFILCKENPTQPLTAINPKDSAVDVEAEIELSWQPEPFNSTYRIQLSDKSDLSTILIDTSIVSDSWVQCHLKNEVQYFWRVKALYDNGETQWSKTYMFLTMKDTVLASPHLLFPPDQDNMVPVSGFLSWEEVPGAESYNVEIALDPEFEIPIEIYDNVDSTSVRYNDLMVETLHYWHVSASNGKYISPWSETWHFITSIVWSVDDNNTKTSLSYFLSDDKLSFIPHENKGGSIIICLYDFMGNLVAEVSGISDITNNNSIDVNISSLSSGVYFFRICFNDIIKFGKILIEQ